MADSNPPEGSFFGRWSQRKVQARVGSDKNENENTIDQKIVENYSKSVAEKLNNSRPESENKLENVDKKNIDVNTAPPAPPSPSLDDVAKLTVDSDYSAFAARSVDPGVHNAAMRKLFSANPHFNVMDGLDVYIDDYSVGEPIPKSMLRQMVQARSLGLLDDDLEDQDLPSSADAPTALAANDTGPIHENADLQLQRDDAAGHAGLDKRLEAGDEADLDANLDPIPNPNAEPGPADQRPG
jgi:Protein of unknown function (DUF3306)